MKRMLILVSLLICSFAITAKTPPKTPCSQGTAYRSCKACGKTQRAELQRLNVLKNRGNVATNPTTITAQEIRDPENDTVFKPSKKVSVTAFVASIVSGGKRETCNCKRDDLRDVHINIVANPSEVGDPTKYVIVEFTPRWEKKFDLDDSDYEAMLQAVKDQIEGKWVKFTGWMMSDFVHAKESKNTAAATTPTCKDDGNDPQPCVWRATTWEVHPVTSYAVVPAP